MDGGRRVVGLCRCSVASWCGCPRTTALVRLCAGLARLAVVLLRLFGVLYEFLYDVLLLLLCWLCVRAWACAGAMVAWYQSSACDDGPARLCVVSGVGTLADGGTQGVSDGSLWGVGSIGVVDGGRRVVGLCRCGAAS